MEKRMAQLLEAFEHLKFEQCLRMCDQILKKIQKSDGKKKNAMSQTDLQNMHLTQIGSLAATGQLHEANQIIKQKFQYPIISQEYSFLFLQICMMALDNRINSHVTTILDSKEKKNIDINRFILHSRKFSILSRILLKKFANEKKNSDWFAQIYLQYMQQLENNKMIVYRRDRLISQNKNLDFKFVSLFLDKFANTIKALPKPKQIQDANFQSKIIKAIADLKIKIFIHNGKCQQTRKMLQQNKQQLKNNIYCYLRSLVSMNDAKKQNLAFYINSYLSIFRQNLNLDNYQPIFDFSVQFIEHVLNSQQINITELLQGYKVSILQQNQMYVYKQDIKAQLINYIDSLYSQHHYLKQGQSEFKKKDYYKISLKNCMMNIIYIMSKTNKVQEFQKMLLQYKQEYGKKLTFVDEIWRYITNVKIYTPQFSQIFKQKPNKIQGDEDYLIWQINYQRMYAKDPLKNSLQQNFIEWKRLHQLYTKNLVQIQKQKKLQKGERYLSDQFVTILTDSIRKYLQLSQNLQQIKVQQISFYILNHLQKAIKKSPHNHDLKLRTIYFCDKLNYHQQSFRILQSLDIKAVQFETLGYFYLKDLINFNTWDTNQQVLVKIIRSYQQVMKQTIQYSYKALLGVSFNQCQQNLCYYEHIKSSYNFLILMYVMYLKNRGKPNCQFYLKHIIQAIHQHRSAGIKLSLSCDGKILTNSIDPSFPVFVDYYGIYNSPLILQTECKIRLFMNYLQNAKPDEQIQQLRKSIKVVEDVDSAFQFQQFNIYDRKINYKYSGKMDHERKTKTQFLLMQKVNRIMLQVCDFVLIIRKQNNCSEYAKKIQNQIQQLNQIINKLSWRMQTLFLPQIRNYVAEIVSLLATQTEALSSKKKKIQGQAQKKQLCQGLISAIIEAVTQKIKLHEKLKVDKQYITQSFAHRDDLLQRVTVMSLAEFKKLYKLKL